MSESYFYSPTGRVKPLSRQQQACLDVLRAAGPRGATGMDLQAGGSGRQYPQRIKELRDDYGFRIPFAKYVGKAGNNSSIFKYKLISSPTLARREGPVAATPGGGLAVQTASTDQSFSRLASAEPQAPETGVGANQEPVHRSWVDDATPIPVCEAERLFDAPAEVESAITGKAA